MVVVKVEWILKNKKEDIGNGGFVMIDYQDQLTINQNYFCTFDSSISIKLPTIYKGSKYRMLKYCTMIS